MLRFVTLERYLFVSILVIPIVLLLLCPLTIFCILPIPVVLLLLVRIKRMIFPPKQHVIGIFHPFADQRGGGEMVLWSLMDVLLRTPSLSHTHFIIYTDAPLTPYNHTQHSHNILQRASTTFGVQCENSRITFIFLKHCQVLDPSRYPRFTLILQSLSALLPAFESLCHTIPTIMFDTAGYPFSYPLFRAFGCIVSCYTHYPTISVDMVDRVARSEHSFNNSGAVASSRILTTLKLWYYRAFALAYRLAGGACAQIVLVNSHWTQAQIIRMWSRHEKDVHVIFPPCPIQHQLSLSLDITKRKPVLLSISQFRPEKNHMLQIESFQKALKLYKGPLRPQFYMVGTVRPQDEPRITTLLNTISSSGLSDHIKIMRDMDRSALNQLLGESLIGIHTMRDEHFGIGVVELMAGGTITIAHNSGGPLSDIVKPDTGSSRCGYLATTSDEYASAIVDILNTYDRSPSQLTSLQQRARQHAMKFSVEQFEKQIHTSFIPQVLKYVK